MPKATDINMVWIEIKPKVDTPEGWQGAVELVNNMLNKLSEDEHKTFSYAKSGNLLLNKNGGSYTVQTDNGAWFNLDYLGRKEEKENA